MSRRHEALYIAAISDEQYESKNIETEIIAYPANSLRSKVLWKLENASILSNWYNPRFHQQLKARIDAFNPDIIHCQFAYEGLKLWDNYKTDKPIFINFRGYDASYKLRNKSYVRHLKKILSRPNVFPIFVCEALKKNLLDKGITLNKSNLVLYTGVNTSNFIRTNFQKKKDPVLMQKKVN
jgi:colanic acid/amylovoran biosynthesis glycosyltransferase